MFASGSTINVVTHKERNLLIYKNMLTGKHRRVKGFVDENKTDKTCQVRFVKMLDHVFEKYAQDKIDLLDMPF